MNNRPRRSEPSRTSNFQDRGARSRPSIRARRDGYREAGEWQQAEGDQRDRAAQKVFARAGSRKPLSDQHQECSTTDNHGYGRLTCMRRIKISPTLPIRECQIRYLKMPEITAKMTPGMVARRCVWAIATLRRNWLARMVGFARLAPVTSSHPCKGV